MANITYFRPEDEYFTVGPNCFHPHSLSILPPYEYSKSSRRMGAFAPRHRTGSLWGMRKRPVPEFHDAAFAKISFIIVAWLVGKSLTSSDVLASAKPVIPISRPRLPEKRWSRFHLKVNNEQS